MRLQMRRVLLLGARVGLGDRHHLQERQPVRVAVAPLLLGELPVAVEDLATDELGPAPAQVHERVVAPEDVDQRAGRPAARDPDRRMRLLDRPRPQVHLPVLLEPAVPRERLGLGPRLEDQLAVLVVALAGLDRRDGAVLIGVVAEPDRKAGDQPPAGDVVEQRVLLGDLQRLARLAERAPEDGDRRVEAFRPRGVRHRRRHQVRVGRDVVRRLAVLGHAHAVEAGSGRMQQLGVPGLERFLHPLGLHQIEVRRGHHRAVAILEACGQVPIRHLLEHADLHPRLLNGSPPSAYAFISEAV